jgi:glutamyl-tRNA synthetase
MLADGLPFQEKFDKETISSFLKDLSGKMLFGVDEPTWFAGLKEVGAAHGFATDKKAYKANPEAFKGNVSDFSEILRVALTGSRMSPNLHEIIEILGKEEVAKRLNEVSEKVLA